MLTQNSVTSFSSVPLALGIYVIILLPAKDEWVSSENVTAPDSASPQSDPNVVDKKSKSPKSGWGSFKPFGRPAKTEGTRVGVVRPDKGRRKKLHKKAKEPEEVEEDEPNDDIVNSPLTVDGISIYVKNPCRKYKENHVPLLKKPKNYKRKKGCKHAANHVKDYIQATGRTLPNCPDPGPGRCFQFAKGSGRCYILVNSHAPREERRYELINNCFYSIMAGAGILPPAAVPPPPPPSPLAGVPPQQPLTFPAGG